MCLARRIIIIWMMAVTIHFPVPVCDGDDLKSWESPGEASRDESSRIDIDLVLLGCALPDDVDDGPVDDDPKDVNTSFGDDFASLNSGSCDREQKQSVQLAGGHCFSFRLSWGMDADGEPFGHFLLSLGNSCRHGQAVLRC